MDLNVYLCNKAQVNQICNRCQIIFFHTRFGCCFPAIRNILLHKSKVVFSSRHRYKPLFLFLTPSLRLEQEWQSWFVLSQLAYNNDVHCLELVVHMSRQFHRASYTFETNKFNSLIEQAVTYCSFTQHIPTNQHGLSCCLDFFFIGVIKLIFFYKISYQPI